MVVEFQDPTRDERPDVEDLAQEFVDASVKYFWPAIYRGDVEITVETPDDTFTADVERPVDQTIRPSLRGESYGFSDVG